MLTVVFLIFIGMFLVGGIVISVMAKKRKNGTVQRSGAAPGSGEPQIGRATGSGDD